MSNRKNALSRSDEIRAASFFGKHVSKEKAIILFVVTSLISAAPIFLGLRLKSGIPEIITTGLTDLAGNDDSLPRWAFIYMIPGLFFVLNAICHVQLYIHQRLSKLPPAPVRLLGRWIIPVIGFLFCVWAMPRVAGQSMPGGFKTACITGMILIYAGGYLFDCKKDAALSFNFKYMSRSETARKGTNDLAGICFMVSGLILIYSAMLMQDIPAVPIIIAVALLIFPFPASYMAYGRKK